MSLWFNFLPVQPTVARNRILPHFSLPNTGKDNDAGYTGPLASTYSKLIAPTLAFRPLNFIE